MAGRPFLRVLGDDAEFRRLKADSQRARELGQYPSSQEGDPCSRVDEAPADTNIIDLDVDRWRQRGHTLEHALRVSVASGLLSAMPSEDTIRQVLRDEGDEVDTFHHWFALMRAAGRAILFDTEAGTFPNRHDELILKEFGGLRPEVFGPTDAAECWHSTPAPSAGHYDVAFLHGGCGITSWPGITGIGSMWMP